MDTRPIGMFDSGVGGITVFKELISRLPNEDVVYIGDTASFPYGSKSKQTIVELTKRRIENLIEKDVKLIVIACGTATSQALEEVKKIYNIPIIGIIEPTVKYLKQMNKRKIGVIATSGTIRSNGWTNAIKKEINNCEIYNKACPLLAPMAEEGWIDNDIAKLTIHEYLKDMKEIDSLVLGCTHYPLFKNIIEKELKGNVEAINTGEMVSVEIEKYIKKYNMQNIENREPEYKIYLTDTECNFINVTERLIENKELIKSIELI